MKKHDMNIGDYAVYSISVTGLVKGILEQHHVSTQYLHQQGDTFTTPRICTFWRGDDAEMHWQNELRAALLKADDKADITITAEPWAMLPGYPIDMMEATE